MAKNSALPAEQRAQMLGVLEERFERNRNRHPGIEWEKVLVKLEAAEGKLWSLHEMERTCGEPDVVGYDDASEEYLFCDCSAETPSGRRSLCYDRAALDARKKNKPENSAMDVAASMGIQMLTEGQYRTLQSLGEFDLKTSSWVVTPEAVRKRGGALFCDRRYGMVFLYHNGADSYYSSRGFRGMLGV